MEIHETYEQWEERVTRAREARGKAEGKAEGKAQGKAEALLRLLRRRFGPLDQADEDRVTGSDDAAINQMLDRVLTATSPREAIG